MSTNYPLKNQFFNEKEQIGIELFDFLSRNKPEFKHVHFMYEGCPYDIKGRSGNTLFIGEIKVRIANLDTTIRNGPYCEFLKWAGMKKQADKIERTKNIKIRLLYLNFVSDGIAIYELKDIKSELFEWKMLPESNLDFTLIDKYVTKLYDPIEIIRYSEINIGSHGTLKISEK